VRVLDDEVQRVQAGVEGGQAGGQAGVKAGNSGLAGGGDACDVGRHRVKVTRQRYSARAIRAEAA
jgi:hypothetical protein